ncbi:hypothetical protein ABPG73_023049 [Tetrahymena malaccensis]
MILSNKQQQTQQDIQTHQEHLIGREQRQEIKETEDEKLQETNQQVSVPAFKNRQKITLDMEQLSNNHTNSYNIEKLLFSSNNDQSNNHNQSPQSVYQSIYEKNIIDEINLENSNKNRHTIEEEECEIQQPSRIQKNKFQKENFSSYIKSNNNNKKSNFNTHFDEFQFRFYNKNPKGHDNNKEEIEVLNSEQYKYEEKATNDSVEIKDEKQKKTIKSNPVPAFSSKRKVSLEKFVNNYIQTQNTEQGSPTNLQVLNALQTAQCLNLQNFNDIASENLSLQKNITSYTEENTQASKINQQQLSNMQGDAISNWASQKIIQKKSNFNNKNEAFNQKYQRDILSERKHANIINNLKAIQDLECSQKILSDIRKIKKQMKEQKGFELQKVQYQIRKDMNIFNFVKDIILIKKAIMMILTKDQLAAINLVGCSSNFLEKNLNNISCNLDQFEFEQNLSHYEMQQTILQKEEFQNRFIETFLSRCSNESNISEIDTRIISSIKACHLN